MDELFTVLHDFSGRTRLESEDPRWIHMFDLAANSTHQTTLIGENSEFLSICSKLVVNSKSTQNFQMLLEQTSSRIGQMLSLRRAPSLASCSHCFGALRLTAAIINYMLSHLNTTEVFLLYS